MIKEIKHTEALTIRHKVMWPDKPMNFVKPPNDINGRHFGLFIEEKLISVVSIFKNDNEFQFRKLATLEEYQGKGFGTKLLNFIIRLA